MTVLEMMAWAQARMVELECCVGFEYGCWEEGVLKGGGVGGVSSKWDRSTECDTRPYAVEYWLVLTVCECQTRESGSSISRFCIDKSVHFHGLGLQSTSRAGPNYKQRSLPKYFLGQWR